MAHHGASRVDLAITAGFVIIGAFVVTQAREWPLRAGLFPMITGTVMFGLALLKLVVDLTTTFRQPARVAVQEAEAAGEPEKEPEPAEVFMTATREQWLSAIGWTASFFVMLWVLGALVTVPLFAVAYLIFASRESYVVAGVYALICWVFVYGLFDRVLHIPLPAGVLLTALGL